jgi:hypothetical protein
MKAISLWQPWASCMAAGVKRNETRSWATSYRGPLAIHAAKLWSQDVRDWVSADPFFDILKPRGSDGRSRSRPWITHGDKVVPIPLGAVVCVVEIYDCVLIREDNAPSGLEFRLGDYTPGRYMWQTRNPRVLTTPLEFRGMQGLFEIPDSQLTGVSL